MTKRIEILIVVVVLFLLAAVFGCKEKAKADEPTYLPIYDRALSAEEVADIDRKLSEPSEPEAASSWSEAVVRWPDAQGYITDNFGNTIPIIPTFAEPEPNGLEIEYLVTPGMTAIVIAEMLQNIPTWPAHIELGKELCIDMPFGPRIGDRKLETWRFPKGTKIYFKGE